MLELKLNPPSVRPGIIDRPTLMTRLDECDTPVVTISGPPGYGKTTVMAQWREREHGPTAWLSLDRSDNDPAVLLNSLAEAFLSAGLVDAPLPGRGGLSSEIVPLQRIHDLIGAVTQKGVAGTLMLDQIDSLRTRNARDVIGYLLTSLPPNLSVMLTARSTSGLPLALLRSRGVITELSTTDLAMDDEEAREMLDHVGVDIEGTGDLLERTEGWPAGIYLTALAVRAGASTTIDLRGDDVFVADYFREELLKRLSDSRLSFLMRSSVLATMSGPLCDFVLETEGSAQTLQRLEASNLMVQPMDRTRTWYRYHSLLRDYLGAEMLNRDAEELAALHSRAATWYAENGLLDEAVEHAIAAADTARVAEFVTKAARAKYANGHLETLSRWLDWLEANEAMAEVPALAALGSFARSLQGEARSADRLARYAFNTPSGELRPGEQLEPIAKLLRSYRAPSGVDAALADARSARRGFEDNHDWLHVAMGAEALALMARGENEAADVVFAEALPISGELRAHPFTAAALAERAVLAIKADRWDLAEEYISDSMGIISSMGIEGYVTSALTFTVTAQMATREGDIERARSLMGQASAIRPRMTATIPILAVGILLEMARTFVELADVAGARKVLREASDILVARPRLGILTTEHDELKQRLSSLPAGTVGPSSLTNAELRLLPLLVTHLTYPEIGERLFVSRHTVKTQAMAIYRKLGVSSRNEAVEAARRIGLLT